MFRHQFAELNSVRLHYVEGPPAGPPVLLLHGFPGSIANLRALLAPLAATYHVFALDARGQGRSGRAARYNLEDFGADVHAFLERVIVEPCLVFGHSGGGLFALLAAAQEPERVRALALGDVPLDIEFHIEHAGAVRHMFVAFQEIARSTAPLATRLADYDAIQLRGGATMAAAYDEASRLRDVSELATCDPTIFAPWVEERYATFFRDSALPAAPAAYPGPVLFVGGDPERGALLTDEELAKDRRRFTRATHVRVAGVSHSLGMDSWEVHGLLAALDAFFGAVT